MMSRANGPDTRDVLPCARSVTPPASVSSPISEVAVQYPSSFVFPMSDLLVSRKAEAPQHQPEGDEAGWRRRIRHDLDHRLLNAAPMRRSRRERHRLVAGTPGGRHDVGSQDGEGRIRERPEGDT